MTTTVLAGQWDEEFSTTEIRARLTGSEAERYVEDDTTLDGAQLKEEE